jgi:NADH-quinone oxidoreductase subunit C
LEEKEELMSQQSEKKGQPEYLDGMNNPFVQKLKEKFKENIINAKTYGNELTIWISKDILIPLCKDLWEEGFIYLVDIMGIHQPKEEKNFALSYILHNFKNNERVRLKVEIKEGELVPSLTEIWKGANWLEREAFDMFGILFSNHPNLERILMWEGFEGHPLRKDFPLKGINTGASIYPDVYPEGGGPPKKEDKNA